MTRRTLVRMVLVASLAVGGLVTSSAPSDAAFHQMKIVEVFAGTNTDSSADFVELQMWSANQNFVGGHVLHLYSAPTYPGEPFLRQDCAIPADVPVGANQSRILFATTQAQAALGEHADFTMPPALSGDGGAVCFEGIDCVAWGSFSGSTTPPTGNPEPAIPPDQSIHRDLKGGTLEDADDTDDSAADFFPGPPSASANGSTNRGPLNCQAGTTPAPGGVAYDLEGLKAKVKGGRARISGRIQPPAPGQRVKLTFFANGSPLRRVASKRAALNAESEFSKRFKVPSDSIRCKIVVRFQGSKMGQKKFRC